MNRNKLFKPALTALLGAIVLAMSLIPQIGFLTIFPGLVSITLVHIPVLVGIFLLDSKHSAILGGIFGLGSLFAALLYAASPLDQAFIYPWISILPRIAFGLLAFYLVKVFKKLGEFKFGKEILFVTVTLLTTVGLYFGMRALANYANRTDILPYVNYLMIPIFIILGGVFFFIIRKYDNYSYIPSTIIVATFMHTILVLGTIGLLQPAAFSQLVGGNYTVIVVIFIIALSNGLIEAIVGALVGTPIVMASLKRLEGEE